MALRDQPYLPLYVQDFLTDEKLCECSAEATGVYILLMCLMHKSHDYGAISIKQKDKQNSKQNGKQNASTISAFAYKLTRQMPFSADVIERGLTELIDEGVLTFDGDRLFQKRMVRDGKISAAKALAGRKGGQSKKQDDESKQNPKQNLSKELSKTPSKTQSKSKANSENENEIETEYDTENDNETDLEDVTEIDAAAIVEAFNTICTTLPKVKMLTDARRKGIRLRSEMLEKAGITWDQYFQMAHNSDFLSGRNDEWHGCSFDWLIKAANMPKVLEGNYSREATGKKEGGPSVEKLWRDLCKAADEMVGLKKYSIYEGLVNGGDPERFYEEKEAKKRACWDGLPAICRGYIGDEDRLAALGKVKHEERERFDFPRFRRFVQEEKT